MAHAHDPTQRIREERHIVERRDEPLETHARPAHALYATLVQLVYLIFGIFEVLLVVRFVLKLGNANTANAVVAATYGITEPLVRPFVGIFQQPPNTVAQLEIPALLALVFLILVEVLVLAIIRTARAR